MFESSNHSVVMFVLGLGYAGLVASNWPLIPFTVSEDHVGLAYGIVTALQNLGLTVMPLLVRKNLLLATINTSSHGLKLNQDRTDLRDGYSSLYLSRHF